MKRIFTLLFGAMLAGQAMASSIYDFSVDNLQYIIFEYNEDEVYVASTVSKPEGEIVIPSTVQNDGITYTVTTVGPSAFANCDKLTSVTIPNTVTTIREFAFKDCKGLTSVTLSENLAKIYQEAFNNCNKLPAIDIPESVTSIGEKAFYDCSSLASVTIPNSVTKIGKYAFACCSGLKSITILNNVMEEFEFLSCTSLTSITIPDGITSISKYAFQGCSSLTSVSISNTVESIGYQAFRNCSSLESVEIPEGVTTIADGVFEGCVSLKSIIIAESVVNMGGWVFVDCEKLSIKCRAAEQPVDTWSSYWNSYDRPVYWGYGRPPKLKYAITSDTTVAVVQSDGYRSITSVVIPDTVIIGGKTYFVTSIGDDAFSECYFLTTVTLPEGITSIGDRAFQSCGGLKSINIPNSVRSIGYAAFYWARSLTSINLPEGINCFDRSVFIYSGLTSITIPESVTSIGEFAVAYTDITSVSIPKNVTNIDEGAFMCCEDITFITIPKSVTTIGPEAFYDCTSLTIYCEAESQPEGWDENWNPENRPVVWGFDLNAIPYNVTLSVNDSACGSVKGGGITFDGYTATIVAKPAYGYRFVKWSNGLKNAISTITVTSDTTLVAEFADARFSHNGLYYIATSDSTVKVTYSGDYYKKLTSVAIPDTIMVDGKVYSVTCIGDQAFTYSSNLTSVTLPESVTKIEYYAFNYCEKLSSITIPGNVKTIDYYVFNNCTALASITIPNSVTFINHDAFYYCNEATIFCESAEKPSGWNDDWNSSDRPVVWGCKAVKIETNDADLGNVTTNPVGGIAANDSLWFANGATVELTVKPLNGHFVKWENGGTAKSRTITIADGATYTATFEQHTIVVDSAVAPTATTDGLTEGSHCSVCREVIVAQEVIPALGEVAYYTYKIIGGSSVEITGYTGSRTDISIPSEIVDDGTTYTVTDIAREAFSKNGNLTSVAIPNTVTYIGDNAFEDCDNLPFVVIPNSVTHIGDGAFSGCTSLESVTLPDAITYIPSAAFGGCTSLKSIEIPSTVEFIGNSAFSGSGLTSISIPNSVTEISSFAFQDCKGLSTIIIPESVEKISNWTFKGCENLTIYCCASSIPDGWETYWNSDNRPYDLGNCSAGRRWTVTVSANNSAYGSVTGGGAIINGSTTTISATPASGYEFVKWSNGLTNATETITVISDTAIVAEFVKENLKPADSTSFSFNILSESARTIEVSRYYGTGKAAAIPAKTVIDGVEYTVTSIGEDAFIYCRELTSVSIPNSVTNIEGFAFYGCTGLKSLTVPNSVTSIGWQAFDKVKNVIYTGNATGSPWYALAINGVVDGDFIYSDSARTQLVGYIGTNVNVTIPNTVVSIGESAFEDSKIKTLTIPNTVTSISPNMCSDCDGLTSITIPNSVTSIGYRAFYCCSNLKSVTIPNSVEEIDDYAFYGCHSLTSVNLPNSVTDIGEESFAWCNNLMEINVDDGNNYYVSVDGVLFNKDKTTIVCCPAGRTGTYTIPNSVTTIGDAAFEFTKLSSVTIPNTVVDIEEDAFNNSDSLAYLNIPNSVKGIGIRACYCCSNLASLTIPNSVTSIDWYAFTYCYKLKSVACLATVPPVLDEDDPFVNTDTVYVLPDYVAAYKAADVWNKKTILPITVKSSDATSGIVYSGDNVLLFAEPKEGYHFVSWSDNSVENPRKTTESEASLTARFEAHIAVVDSAVAATCTATGLTEGSHCSVCGAIIIAQTQTPMIEHTSVVDSAVAATCTATGLTEGSHCSVCGKILIAQTQTPMVEHTVVVDGAVAATCMESGKTEGYHCRVCGEVLVAQKEIPALGHEFANYIYNNDATTEADGTETAQCAHGCGETDTRVAEGTKLPKDNTSVSESAASAVNIYAHGSTIIVENATEEICVYDAMGRLVGRDAINRVRTEIRINTAGVYLVKVGGVAKRVMVN